MSQKPLPPIPVQPNHHWAHRPGPVSYREAPPSYRASVQGPSSLDFTQRFEKRLAEYNASQSVIKRWLFEITSWTLSAACMGAIVGILIYSQDQPLSQRPLVLGVVNVLSKVAAAALILPISEAIGQLKWSWFQDGKSKEMIDFEIFDKASRGAWGSFLLLFRTKGRSLAALGAVLTLLLLATDTFFQQVSDLSERWILEGHGDIPRIVQYIGDPQFTYLDGVRKEVEEWNLRRVTLQYFYENGSQPIAFGNGTRPNIPLSCASSRCEWDAYETLGVCSSCSDASDLLEYACLTTKVDWTSNLKGIDATFPNGTSCGYWLNSTGNDPVLMSGFRVNESSNALDGEALLLRTLPLNTPVSLSTRLSGQLFGGSIHYKDVYAPLLDALIVSSVDGTAESVYEGKPPVAHECVLNWCVKTLSSSYSFGNYEETVLGTVTNNTGRTTPNPWSSSVILVSDEPLDWISFDANYSIYTTTPNMITTEYGVSNHTFATTQALFEDIFPSMITVANRTTQPWWRYQTTWWSANYVRAFTYCAWLAPHNITAHMESFATDMTNSLRSHKSAEYLTGRAYTQTTFIAVHWVWLLFPLTLLFLSLAFLIATMLKTRGPGGEAGIWKTSAMPTLIYSLPQDVRQNLQETSKTGNEKAKKVKIRLSTAHGWRVSGQSRLSPTFMRRLNHQPPPGWI
ncbi:hypothetical protein OPT61_g4394 [Boeremia exigua]|uniref:Uncharacterized protein n=1 Tax=Boeremia exigua TaxID=749465 RepID=A0ACC2IEA1_9PLEO|nr:hypothetical protein OPT61_g4394 [Boeremia exigua]